MNAVRTLSILTLAVASTLAASLANAAIINQIDGDPTGLIAPTRTITFDEHVLVQDTVVTNQYADLGVIFGATAPVDMFAAAGLHYNPLDSSAPYPLGITGRYLGNYPSDPNGADVEPVPPPDLFSVTMTFASTLTRAAFGLASNGSDFSFTAFLGDQQVDTFVATVDSTDDNPAYFYGFTGESFDSIVVTSLQSDYFDLDNIQFDVPVSPAPGDPSAVPEPESVALLGLGLLGALSVRRRSRKAT